ncbi:hypothetical protein [Antarcticirhabdus aurantiaca]|uniref:Uncharacterized protein n=1 Tax=Antarcticirhabdus aurantiaca TaxID=2606717 RepID=A0ACD4NPA0_9HYPH|nr:hypothetical protein [Antarcticirhabdus aurantiaca]WAJ28686.1 hypothetical protein OXU80_00050 [Jeongeuplla avenae]
MADQNDATVIMDAFLAALDRLPSGYSEGVFEGRRYGATLNVSPDRRRVWLYAEELGGADRVSFNLYRLSGGRSALKPCEMSSAQVVGFVVGYRPDAIGSP